MTCIRCARPIADRYRKKRRRYCSMACVYAARRTQDAAPLAPVPAICPLTETTHPRGVREWQDGDHDGMTVEGVGDALGVSKQRAGQLLTRAIRSLRWPPEMRRRVTM